MKVLVTGSEGLIGSALIPFLEAKEHEVTRCDKKLDSMYDCENDAVLEEMCAGQDVVIHMAAISWPDPKMEAEEFFRQNVANAFGAVSAAAAAGVPKFIFTSSTTVYGFEDGMSIMGPFSRKEAGVGMPNFLQYIERPGKLMTENPATFVKLNYITAKIAAEALVAQYGLAQKMRVIIMRLAPVRSPSHPYLGLAVDGKTLAALMERCVTDLSNDPGLQVMDAVEPYLTGSGKPIITTATEEEMFQCYLR